MRANDNTRLCARLRKAVGAKTTRNNKKQGVEQWNGENQ
jgi:hypothetical protein